MISKRLFAFAFPFFLCQLSFFSCREKVPEEEIAERQRRIEEEDALAKARALEAKRTAAVLSYIDSFSDEVKVSQLFLVNIEGNGTYSSVESADDGKPLVPGGCLLFSYNIASEPEKIFAFTKSISDFYLKNSNIPPYIAIDQEGGDVNRLRGVTSVLWSQKKVGERFSVENAKKLYAAQAKQMRLLGIDMNLAPVVEVEDGSNAEFLGTRTFGSIEKTLSYGEAEIGGFEENGVATVLKHFPGNSNVDPHSGLPELKIASASFDSYIKPFSSLLPGSSALLMSHAIVEFDTETSELKNERIPACLSEFWVSKIVRGRLSFDGLILSDDIFMGALSKNGYPPEKAVVQAIESGINVIMLSEKKFGSVAKILLDESSRNESLKRKIDDSVRRVVEYKIKAGILSLEESENGEYRVVPAAKAEFDSEAFASAKKEGMKLYE